MLRNQNSEPLKALKWQILQNYIESPRLISYKNLGDRKIMFPHCVQAIHVGIFREINFDKVSQKLISRKNRSASRNSYVHTSLPMSNCENCAFTEFLPNGILNEVVRLQINGRSGLIEDKDLRFAQQGSGQTNELPLTN